MAVGKSWTWNLLSCHELAVFISILWSCQRISFLKKMFLSTSLYYVMMMFLVRSWYITKNNSVDLNFLSLRAAATCLIALRWEEPVFFLPFRVGLCLPCEGLGMCEICSTSMCLGKTVELGSSLFSHPIISQHSLLRAREEKVQWGWGI